MINTTIKLSALVFIFTFLFGSVFAQDSGKAVQIPKELVGKWCYLSPVNGGNGVLSNTCITLNSDGSYEFFLDDVGFVKANSFFQDAAVKEFDYGTWSAQGNTIYYNSNANGAGSFQFQKMNQPQNESTPLLVVNGQAFASLTPRDPW